MGPTMVASVAHAAPATLGLHPVSGAQLRMRLVFGEGYT